MGFVLLFCVRLSLGKVIFDPPGAALKVKVATKKQGNSLRRIAATLVDCGNRVVEQVVVGGGEVKIVHVQDVQLEAIMQKGNTYSTTRDKYSNGNAAFSNHPLGDKGKNTTSGRGSTSRKVKPKLSGPVSQKSSYFSF